MKNNQLLIGIGVVVLIILIGGYFVLFANKSEPQKETPKPVGIVEEVVPTISADKLGFTVTARSDNRAVKFAIENAEGISGIDYEISYMAEGDIPRGAIGHIDVEPGDTSVESKFIDLGTCSSGRCKYDEGVNSVKIILKITKTDGKTYQAEKSLNLS